MEPFFLEDTTFPEDKGGKLFALYHPAQASASTSTVLIVPPFAEELNRSRHVMAGCARALAKSGVGALMLDLYGTGDSEGAFRDVTWDGWKRDLDSARDWLEAQGEKLAGVIAIRTGALLTLDWMRSGGPAIDDLVLWAPVTGGAQFITQFLRLRVAESMAREDGAKETTRDLKARLEAGDVVEVGGYGLTGPLCAAIDNLKAVDLPPHGAKVHWFELAQSENAELPPGPTRVIDAWGKADVNVTVRVIEGPAFWSLLEPEPAPALIAATAAVFQGRRS